MSIETNKAFARYVREEFSKGNRALIDEAYAPDVIMHFAGNPEPLNLAAMRQLLESFYEAFPDLYHTFEDQIAEGGKVVTRVTFHGTHLGTFQGIPPTAKKIAVEATLIDRIVDGKFVEHWSNMDSMGLMQ
jgi:predicted ester cyclase